MKVFQILFAVLAFIDVAAAQPALQWARCYGGPGSEIAYSVDEAWDDGFVIAGIGSCQNGNGDFWVVKTDDNGNEVWQQCYGGSDVDIAYAIKKVRGENNNNGYIIVGITHSNDGDVTGLQGLSDIWVVRIDMSGNLVWQKSLGGSLQETGHSVQQTQDGGFIIAGRTLSNDGDVSGNHGAGTMDMWVVKLTSNGDIMWQKALGGSVHELAYSIDLTPDGGYIVAGKASSQDGDVSTLIGMEDYWIVKLDHQGDLQWEKSYGGNTNDYAYSVATTADSGYIVSGVGYYSPAPNTYHTILKLDKLGNYQWSADSNSCTIQASDGGYISVNAFGMYSASDFVVKRMDSTGSVAWSKTMGGSNTDVAHAVVQASDGGYVIAGTTKSNDGDVTGNHGGGDYWLVKLAPEPTGVQTPEMTPDIRLYPNPVTDRVNFSTTVNARVHDITGSLLLDRQQVNSVDMSAYASGVYFVLCYDDHGQIIYKAKVVKE